MHNDFDAGHVQDDKEKSPLIRFLIVTEIEIWFSSFSAIISKKILYVIPSGLLSFLLNYCHSFQIIAISNICDLE